MTKPRECQAGTEHTPTPWCVPSGDGNEHLICLGDEPDHPGPILMVLRAPVGRARAPTDADTTANAAFIVKAVNSHDALVKALNKVRSYNADIAAGLINYRPHDHIQVIDEALASLASEPRA